MSTRGNELVLEVARLEDAAKAEHTKAEGRLRSVDRERTGLQKEYADALLEVARLEIAAGHAVSGVVRTALEERDSRLASVRVALEKASPDLQEAIERTKLDTVTLLDLERVRHETEADLRERMVHDPKHVRLSAVATERAHVKETLETRIEEARSELASKAPAYESDRLFVYLRRRRYGTSAYSAMGPFRRIDGMIARAMRFTEASAAYDRLTRIPVWLEERLQALSDSSERADEDLQAVEAMYLVGLRPHDEKVAAARLTKETSDEVVRRLTVEMAEATKTLDLAQDRRDRWHVSAAGLHARSYDGMKPEDLSGLLARIGDQDASPLWKRLSKLLDRLATLVNDRKVAAAALDAAAHERSRLTRIRHWFSTTGRDARRDIFSVPSIGGLMSMESSDPKATAVVRHLDASHRVERPRPTPRSTGVVVGSTIEGFGGSDRSRSDDWSTGGSIGGSSSGGWSTGGGFGGDDGGGKTGGGF